MILRRKVLRSNDSSPDNYSPEDSSLEKLFPGGGKFFARAFFARMILHRIILH
jgi:hypothetical protein